jgi:hypothetical protein
VIFDTTWSDATAMANSWVQEPTPVPFATLWDDLYTAEVRIAGDGRMEAGIDSYALRAPVPLPAGFVPVDDEPAGARPAGLEAEGGEDHPRPPWSGRRCRRRSSAPAPRHPGS